MSETVPSYDARAAHRGLMAVLDKAIHGGLENGTAETMWTLGGSNRSVYVLGGTALYSIAEQNYTDDIAIVYDPFADNNTHIYDFHVFGQHGEWYQLTSRMPNNQPQKDLSEQPFELIGGAVTYEQAVNYSAIVSDCTTFSAERTALAVRVMEDQKLYTTHMPDTFGDMLLLERPSR